MPRGRNRKTRLPFWTLLFLALILGGGGFFWFSTYQQQLIGQVDRQLLVIARHIALQQTELPSAAAAPKTLCNSLEQMIEATGLLLEIGIYSTEGQLFCSSGEQSAQSLSPGRQKPTLDPRSQQAVYSMTGQTRRLSYRFPGADGKTFISVIDANIDDTYGRLWAFASLLLAAGLGVLTTIACLRSKAVRHDLTTVKRLAGEMDQINADIRPMLFSASLTDPQEIQGLVQSYNALTHRLSDTLRRAKQFSADVTHELRTPLTILRGETELALRSGRDKEQLRQVLESNLEEISRMSYLIEDLLLLSKSDLGEIPLKKEVLEIGPLAKELHHQAQLLAKDKNITVELNDLKRQVVLQADSLRLRQVFLNLLTNAIRYTPEQGTVTIDLKTDRNTLTVTISDTGIGIDQEHLELIFDRFYRGGQNP